PFPTPPTIECVKDLHGSSGRAPVSLPLEGTDSRAAKRTPHCNRAETQDALARLAGRGPNRQCRRCGLLSSPLPHCAHLSCIFGESPERSRRCAAGCKHNSTERPIGSPGSPLATDMGMTARTILIVDDDEDLRDALVE